MAVWLDLMHGMCLDGHLEVSQQSGSNFKLSFSQTYIGIFVHMYTYIHTMGTIYPDMEPGPDWTLGPGPWARPHIRIYDGSYCLCICIL